MREKFNTPSVWNNIDLIYTEGKPYIAGLAQIVFDAYRNGDENAVQIIDNNAKALADLLNIGINQYCAKPLAVVNGGLFEHYSDILVKHINEYSSVKLLVSELSPIYGACRMARTMNGEEIPDDFYDNFKATWKGKV